MGSSSGIATLLDYEMLLGRPVSIAPPSTAENALPIKSGSEVAIELGQRFVLRYMATRQLGTYRTGSTDKHWVTPTPLSPDDVIWWLNLPVPELERTHVMMLDLQEIAEVAGPRHIRLGQGIEYILPVGFPESAVVQGWELELR